MKEKKPHEHRPPWSLGILAMDKISTQRHSLDDYLGLEGMIVRHTADIWDIPLHGHTLTNEEYFRSYGLVPATWTVMYDE